MIACKLMTPLEYTLFIINMIFFLDYYLEVELIRELGDTDRQNVLLIMSVID